MGRRRHNRTCGGRRHKRHAGRRTRRGRGGFGMPAFSKQAFTDKINAAKAAALRSKVAAAKAFAEARQHPVMQGLASKVKNAAGTVAEHAQDAKQKATQYAATLRQKGGKKTRKHRRHRRH